MSDPAFFTPFETPNLPEIPDRTFDIREHGALAGGKLPNTHAVAAAISAAIEAGGGRVLVPAGIWLTGPVHLRSHIELHLEAGAELRFSQTTEDYLPVVYMQRGGVWCYTYSPFIYARDCHDIAITGSGIFNGQGETWWPWKKAQPGMADLFQANADRRPVEKRVYGTREAGVRPPMLQMIESERVLIDGVTFRDSPSWTLHPVCCQDLTIRGVQVYNPPHAANTDGIDPDSCRNVLIEDCMVDTGDDGICLKSGRDADGRELGRPCENVLIRRCLVRRAHGGFVIGSEMSGGVRNVLVEDCEFDETDCGVRIKTRPGRGGLVENIQVQRLKMRNIRRQAIIVTSHYGGEKIDIHDGKDAWIPEIRRIHLRQIDCESAKSAIHLNGLLQQPLRDISLEEVKITAEQEMVVNNVIGLRTDRLDIHISEGRD